MKKGEQLVSAEGIHVQWSGRLILEGVDLSVTAGEIVTLIGPNGAGKTTLVRIVLGLLRPDRGSVWQRPKLRIGYMPQRLQLSENMPLTVRRFLRLIPRVHLSGFDKVIREMGITHLLDNPMQSLSGGEHQRVLLARALMRAPDLLVLDEPVQGVDVAGQAELYRHIGRIRDFYGCGVLMVSHDLHLVMATTDQVMCINHHVCCVGHPESVSQHPAYLELFGRPVDDGLAFYTHRHDHICDEHDAVTEVGSGYVDG
ncbi:MAG: zinc ABC transporter ATP-binding protein ZnuC [Gammaproteobacteria bacterium]|nr:zinc ABC transporter ATP-binding protein ZnuC [Gammaproteobacteria bacterium]